MTVILDYKLTQKKLTDIAQGSDKSLPRNIAINMLATSTIRNSVSLLNKLLIDGAEAAPIRRLAAINLWRSNTPAAHRYLLDAVKTINNPEIMGALVKTIGRIGDAKSIESILEIEKKAQGFLKEQASFAASLLSYRHGLAGHDLPIPAKYLPMPRADQVKLKFTTPLPAEVDVFTNALAQEPFGITYSRDLMQQFSCPRGGWMMAFDQKISEGDAIATLTSRKTLLGVLAIKNSEDGRYSVSGLILSSPGAQKGQINILINRINGAPLWAGSTTVVDAKQVKFKIQTVGSLGVVPMEMEGVFSANGKLTVTNAISGTKVSEKKHPMPHN